MLDLSNTKRIELKGGCNTSDEILLSQVNSNIRLGFRQVLPYDVNPNEALLVCGGPSLNATKKELIETKLKGGKVFATNGAYNWCLENKINPGAMILLDARESNTRFVEKGIKDCWYLLASQCHPKVFEICKDRKVLIWHAASCGDDEIKLLEEFYHPEPIYPITLGTTVGIRAISLLRMLGFTKIQIFGLDSCWFGNDNHAYLQSENENDKKIEVWLRPENRDDKAKKFLCSPWMIKQAEDFLKLVRKRGNLFDLIVHGDGLIANMLKTGAEIQTEISGN
jgi:hypothetical protein